MGGWGCYGALRATRSTRRRWPDPALTHFMSVQPQLSQVESAGLVRVGAVEPELLYLFRHGLIQDAAYSTLLRSQLRSWHAATAEVLQSACRSDAEVITAAPILARHFSLPGRQARAPRYTSLAAAAALDPCAN